MGVSHAVVQQNKTTLTDREHAANTAHHSLERAKSPEGLQDGQISNKNYSV